MKYAVFGILDGEERIVFVRATSKQKLNEFLRDRFGGGFIVKYIDTLEGKRAEVDAMIVC